MEKPLVSILCLCYNHESFIDEAFASLENLTYRPVEILVADDASSDASVKKLEKWRAAHPEWSFTYNKENQGNCKTFNHLLWKSSGRYIVDFATDDRLVSDGLEAWVERLENSPHSALSYADAWIFGKGGKGRALFSDLNPQRCWPEGSVLPDLFAKPFICPPAVLFRTSVLKEIGGYNEQLAYEDWNVWLRLARHHTVVRHPQPVVEYRQHPNSLSASLFLKRNVRLLDSTLVILCEVLEWDEVKTIHPKVAQFVRYHLKIAATLELRTQTEAFWKVLVSIAKPDLEDWFWRVLSLSKIPVYWIAKHLKK